MMRRVYLLILFMALIGCSSGSTSTKVEKEVKAEVAEPTSNEGGTGSTDMILNEEYVMQKGDTIVKDSSDTEIELVTDIESSETVAILKRGKAHIE
jgi:hypothetical protein